MTNEMASSTIHELGINRPLAEVSDLGALTFYHQNWLNNVVLLTDALGTKAQSYTYDAVERLDSITVSKGGAALWAELYGYNAAGERIHTLRGTTGTLGDAYWLDAVSQLRGVKYGVADATGAYAGITAGTYSEWSYDAAGNRLQETGSAGTVNYTANAINQYTAITGTGTLGYSARGDLTQAGGWTLSYDAYGNLLRAYNTDTDTLAKYWRDASGHRAVKDMDGNKTIFFNLGTAQLEAYDVTADTVSSTIYEPGIDRPLAEVSDDGTVTFYHQDWLGSVVLLTDESGAKVQSYTYDAWGAPNGFDASDISIPISSISSRLLFTGREYDQETSLYHYRARAYAPMLGRFLQPDPIDFSGGDENLFRYVDNNVVNFGDPSGLAPGDWWDPRTPHHNARKAMDYAECLRGEGQNDSDHHAIAVRTFGELMENTYNSELVGDISSILAAAVGNFAEAVAPSDDWQEDMDANMFGIGLRLAGNVKLPQEGKKQK